jgi:hypothetical protein
MPFHLADVQIPQFAYILIHQLDTNTSPNDFAGKFDGVFIKNGAAISSGGLKMM